MKKRLLLGLLLVAASVASAETFYLLSKERARDAHRNPISPPLPYNPLPNAPRFQIVDNIWLVDDSAYAPLDSTATPIDEIGLKLALRIQIAREAAAIFAKANPPKPVAPPITRPPLAVGARHGNWIFNTDIFKTMPPNSGMRIRALEEMSPGISTNFSAEQLKIPTNFTKLPTNVFVIPFHINPRSPTYKEDYAKWAAEHGLKTNAPDLKPQ